jgi:hypothetical protein
VANLRNAPAPNPSGGVFRACFQIIVCASPEDLCLRQERLRFTQERFIPETGALHKREASAGRFFLEGIIQNRLQALPSLRIHG